MSPVTLEHTVSKILSLSKLVNDVCKTQFVLVEGMFIQFLDIGEKICIQIILFSVNIKRHVCKFKLILVIITNFRGGYNSDRKEIINLSGFCNEGYEGIACSSCSPGYAKFGSELKKPSVSNFN